MHQFNFPVDANMHIQLVMQYENFNLFVDSNRLIIMSISDKIFLVYKDKDTLLKTLNYIRRYQRYVLKSTRTKIFIYTKVKIFVKNKPNNKPKLVVTVFIHDATANY